VTPVLVDSNVLLDVATRDPVWEPWSSAALADAQETSILVINVIVFGELAAGFSTLEGLDAALPPDLYRREAIPFSAAFLAGRAHREYRDRGGTRVTPLADFYIGAHAAVAGYRLLTRDAARYRTYFPRLQLITPGPEAGA
jgi:predicted nucleic acid-binding protein